MTAFKRSTLAASLAALTFGLTATADDGKPDSFRARLSSYNEVHFIAGNAAATPVVPPALRTPRPPPAPAPPPPPPRHTPLFFLSSWSGSARPRRCRLRLPWPA